MRLPSPHRFIRFAITIAGLIVLGGCSDTPPAATPGPSTLPETTTATVAPTTAAPPVTTTATTLPEAEPELPQVIVSPADDLASLVEAAEPGTRFLLQPGIHRTGEIHPKDQMVFDGEAGTVLSGAQTLSGFASQDDVWVLDGVELDQDDHGTCQDDYEACGYRNDVYMDDTMLWRVDTREELDEGTWWSDGSTIVVADDPENRKVELSVTEYAFISSSDDVTIRNLVVEKYAVRAQEGAIQAALPVGGDRGTGWLIENVETRLNHGAGIKAGEATTMRGVWSHHNGQLGLAGSRGTDILVEDSVIAFNNTRGFSTGWEAGGTKFTRTRGLTIRNTEVHHNLGPGIWTDIDAYGTTYEGNHVHDNTGPGIYHEISFDALITLNTVTGNGFGRTDWLWGGGIIIAASAGAEVSDNTVSGNAQGIVAIQQARDGDNGPYLLSDLWVHNNVVTMETGKTGLAEDIGDRSVFTDRNNRFDRNTYIEARGKAFLWDKEELTWREWNAAGLDTNGSLQ